MNYLRTWPRFLLTLPFAIRFTILGLCFSLCLVIYTLVFPVTYHGDIMIIPLVMAAWMFRKRGLLIAFSIGLFVLTVYHLIRLKSVWWPPAFALTFFSSALILLMIGFVIVSVRNFVDSADAARQQAQQAERQLAIAYEQQRRLNQIKDLFILNVNHELRTPLTAIIGYLEILQLFMEQSGHLDHTTHAPYLEKAMKRCEELQSLVNSVLDTKMFGSRGEPIAFEEIAVATVVQHVLEEFSLPEQRERHIERDIPEHLTIWADVQSVHQVLRNLLSNALKYSPAHTPVVISAASDTPTSQEKHHAPYVRIQVQDNGPGIPPDEIPLLFSQFVRLKRDIAGPVRGTGLGLFISKHLVEAMGGRIWVESVGVPGQGSCFCFTLPCTPNEVIASETAYQAHELRSQ